MFYFLLFTSRRNLAPLCRPCFPGNTPLQILGVGVKAPLDYDHAESARRLFLRPSWNSPLPATFLPWKWFQWISGTQKRRQRHQTHHSRTDPDGVILGIRVRRPSWTPSWITFFCPTSGMSTQVFSISYGSPTGIKSQNWGTLWLHTGPRTIGNISLVEEFMQCRGHGALIMNN